jgi:NitT/TauT family transport system substrate-binding protein
MSAPRNPTRRSVLAGAAATVCMPRPSLGQSLARVRLTLPWLAQGATAFVYVARALGIYKRYGLEVEISRGYGSLAAAQAVAQKRFDFGIVSAGPMILASTRGVALSGLATINYDTTMGVLVRKDSPIRTPSDLVGKKVGSVLTSAEYPFFPAYAAKAGFDAAKVTVVQMDARILERSVIDGQVDAITTIGASSIPLLAAQKVEHRFFPYSVSGIAPYSNIITARQDFLNDQPALCEAVTRALLEGLAFQLREPEKSIDLLVKEVPEFGAAANGRESAMLSLGLLGWTILAPEAMDHGLGWSDPDRWKTTVDLTMAYAIPSGTPRPPVDDVAKNRFTGQQKLSPTEWAEAKKRFAPFGAMLG